MKAIKLLSILLALGIVACALAACGEKVETEVVNKPETQVEEVKPEEKPEKEILDGVPNPVVSYDSVEDAVMTVGHLCPLSTEYDVYEKKAQVIDGSMVQIVYSDDQGKVLTLREERRPSGDISGVYNTYAYNDTIQVDGVDVDVRGDSENSILVVTWNDGAYSHSINYEAGRSNEEVTNVVREINS